MTKELDSKNKELEPMVESKSIPKEENKGGRPTKYKGEETLKKANEYIDSCVDGVKKILESVNKKTGRERFISVIEVRLPKAEGLALCLDISRDTLYEWAKKHKRFSDILERINQIQVDRVFNKTLAGNYNATIAKLLLAKHGYKESSEHSIEGLEHLQAIEKALRALTTKPKQDE